MRRFRNKRAIISIGAVCLVALIGVTIAFNNNSMFFSNLFRLGGFRAEFTEHFDSPENWQPCQEIPKEVFATNKSSMNVRVRLKYEEKWLKNDGTDQETELALTDDQDRPFALINLTNQNDWVKNDSDDYYYYASELAPEATTSTFMESVTLQCWVNTSGEIIYSPDGLVAESGNHDYANARYHLKITIQMASLPNDWPEVAQRETLYQHIASQTTNVAATPAASVNGVNTFTPKKDDSYPVYYFHGEVSDNFVLWSDFCWQIIRTTSTGGIKMMYAGKPTDGQCLATGNDMTPVLGTSPKLAYGYQSRNQVQSMADMGYMGGERIIGTRSATWGTDRYYGTDVVYEDGNYTLTDPKTYSSDSPKSETEQIHEIMNDHHYFCNGALQTSCETVYYLMASKSYPTYELKDGQKIEDVIDAMFADTQNSLAKNMIDNVWIPYYSNGMISNHVGELEDEVFCNDRSVYSGFLRSLTDPGPVIDGTLATQFYKYDYFGAHGRITDGTPSLDCNKRDSFTVSESKGNGKLTNPVGLITADEAILAGSWLDTGGTDCYFTFSPDFFRAVSAVEDSSLGTYYTVCGSSVMGDMSADSSFNLRPVVSLKEKAYYQEESTGTRDNPYIIEW